MIWNTPAPCCSRITWPANRKHRWSERGRRFYVEEEYFGACESVNGVIFLWLPSPFLLLSVSFFFFAFNFRSSQVGRSCTSVITFVSARESNSNAVRGDAPYNATSKAEIHQAALQPIGFVQRRAFLFRVDALSRLGKNSVMDEAVALEHPGSEPVPRFFKIRIKPTFRAFASRAARSQ